MEQLFAGLAKGKGGGDPFGGQMANAQHLWSFLDEMASSDPEEYKKFIEGQIESGRQQQKRQQPPPPDPGFCARLRAAGAPLLVNVCAHVNVKPPASTPDGSVRCAGRATAV